MGAGRRKSHWTERRQRANRLIGPALSGQRKPHAGRLKQMKTIHF